MVASYSPSGAHRWSKTLEGLEGGSEFRGVAVHGNRVVVTGWFTEGFTFEGDAFSAPPTGAGLVAAYTRDGEERWARALGSFGLEVASDLEDDMTVLGYAAGGQDVGSGPLPMGPTGYFFVSKLDRVDGTLKWGRGFHSSPISEVALAVSRHGEPVVAGAFRAPLDLGTGTLTPSAEGRFDVFVLRLHGEEGLKEGLKVSGQCGHAESGGCDLCQQETLDALARTRGKAGE